MNALIALLILAAFALGIAAAVDALPCMSCLVDAATTDPSP